MIKNIFGFYRVNQNLCVIEAIHATASDLSMKTFEVAALLGLTHEFV